MSLSKCTKLIILVLRSPLYPLCSLPCQAEFRLSTHQGLRQRTKVIIKNDWEIELANKFQDRYFLLLQIPARLCKKRCLPFPKKHTTFSLKGCILFRKSMCPFRKKKENTTTCSRACEGETKYSFPDLCERFRAE